MEEETDIISNNKEKKKTLSNSNSECHISNSSKNNIQNMKKLKDFYDINFDKNTNIYNKSKSPNSNKQINYKNDKEKEEFKLKDKKIINNNKNKINNLNIKEFSNLGKLNKMHKNKTEGSLLKVRKKDKLVDINEISNIKEENNNDNMNNNKKNIEDLKRINNHKNDKIKSLKKYLSKFFEIDLFADEEPKLEDIQPSMSPLQSIPKQYFQERSWAKKDYIIKIHHLDKQI